jgi:hypothetical protein
VAAYFTLAKIQLLMLRLLFSLMGEGNLVPLLVTMVSTPAALLQE